MVSIVEHQKIKLVKRYDNLSFSRALPGEEELIHIDLIDKRYQDNWVLPEDVRTIPVASISKMAKEYKDANILSQDLDLAGSPVFDETWKYRMTPIKECCVLLYGNKEKTVVSYIKELLDSGLVTLMPVVCLKPKKGYDVRYIAALLLNDDVKNQIKAICEDEINSHTFPLIIDKVIVPNHKIKERLEFLSEANYIALLSSQKETKEERINYIKAVRNRKHALTQSFSSIESMFYRLNKHRINQKGRIDDNESISRTKNITVSDAFNFLSKKIEGMMPVLEHIADVEYTFNKPESINPLEFMENYIEKEKDGWLHFKPVITWKKGDNIYENNEIKDKNGRPILDENGNPVRIPIRKPIRTIMFPKDALEKIFTNIISNAKSHAFTDESNKDYLLRFSWHAEDGGSIIIEIENNGTPIPKDRNTASLFEYGVSTALHKDGHNGIGCNEIDDIMRRYNGKVAIVSSPEADYTVKYVLTFENTYTLKTDI